MCDDCNWHELLEETEEMQTAGRYEFAHHTLSGIYETVEANQLLHREAAEGCEQHSELQKELGEVMPTEVFKRAAASGLELTAEAMAIFQVRWSDISPEEGTEECACSWCDKMIGRNEADPVWEDHIAYYIGREVCLIAVRVWRPDTEGLELRFHVKCFNEVIATA